MPGRSIPDRRIGGPVRAPLYPGELSLVSGLPNSSGRSYIARVEQAPLGTWSSRAVPADRFALGGYASDRGCGYFAPKACGAADAIVWMIHVVSGSADLHSLFTLCSLRNPPPPLPFPLGDCWGSIVRSMRSRSHPPPPAPEATWPLWVGQRPVTMHANTGGQGVPATPSAVEFAAPKWPPACDSAPVAAQLPMRQSPRRMPGRAGPDRPAPRRGTRTVPPHRISP